MKIIDSRQGTPEWHAHRATARNASDAAVVMGEHPTRTRNEWLRERATGVVKEHGQFLEEKVFATGHAIESAMRQTAEQIIGEELFPIVGSHEVDGIELSASFDGLTLMNNMAWECKTLNTNLRAALFYVGVAGVIQNAAYILPKHHRIQMQQQCMVSGCDQVLFTASDGNGDDRHCWYYPDSALGAEIIAAWRQADIDAAAYVPNEAPQKLVAQAVTALPAVSVQVTGSIAIKDNFAVFEVALNDFIEHRLIRKPETDQDFVDLDQQIKALKGAESALDALEAQMLSQVQAVDMAKRTKDMLHKLTRDNRLAAERLLAARKEQIKIEQIQRGQLALSEHVAALNARLGKPYMPPVTADFAGAIKGLRTVKSLQDAVDTLLSKMKISSNATADLIQANLATLRELASAHAFLFSDTPAIVLKANDDFAALVKTRIAEHKAAEVKTEEATRQRIRDEELARIEREAAQVLADQAKAEAARLEAEAKASSDAQEAAEKAQALSVQEHEIPPTVTRQAPQAPQATAKTEPPRLMLGTIQERLGLPVSADFLASLGFQHSAKQGAAKLYHKDQFGFICDAIVQRVQASKAQFEKDRQRSTDTSTSY